MPSNSVQEKKLYETWQCNEMHKMIQAMIKDVKNDIATQYRACMEIGMSHNAISQTHGVVALSNMTRNMIEKTLVQRCIHMLQTLEKVVKFVGEETTETTQVSSLSDIARAVLIRVEKEFDDWMLCMQENHEPSTWTQWQTLLQTFAQSPCMNQGPTSEKMNVHIRPEPTQVAA